MSTANVARDGTHFDGVTGYAGAEAVARLLPNSRLLSYAGWGHIAVVRSECISQHVVTYLLDGALPAPGTVCPANANPFGAAGSALDASVVGGPVGPEPTCPSNPAGRRRRCSPGRAACLPLEP